MKLNDDLLAAILEYMEPFDASQEAHGVELKEGIGEWSEIDTKRHARYLQKAGLITAIFAGANNVAHCRLVRIRPAGYEWLEAYRYRGWKGLWKRIKRDLPEELSKKAAERVASMILFLVGYALGALTIWIVYLV